MSGILIESLFLGRNRGSLRRMLMIAATLALVSFASVSIARRLTPGVEPIVAEMFHPLVLMNSQPALAVVVVPGWIALSGVVGYRQEGLLGSWVILFGPLFGGLSNDFVIGNLCCAGATTSRATLRASYTPLTHVTNIFLAFVATLGFTIILGTIGYVLGRGAKTVIRLRTAETNV